MDETHIVRGPRKERGFTIIDNSLLNDQALSFRARGVLAYLLSKPTGWKVSAERLAVEAKEGRDAMRTALNEIEAAGYLVRRKWRDPATKRWKSTQTIYDEPQRETSDGSDQAKPQVGPTADFQRQITSDSSPGALVSTGKGLEEGGTPRSHLRSVPSPTPPPPLPSSSPRCEAHRHLPDDAYVPPCRPCQISRERFELQQTPKQSVGAIMRSAREQCPECDESGWVHGVDPVVRCQHPNVRSS